MPHIREHTARPRRILIIGGGGTGLIALRNLTERGEFDDVQLVERRDDVGGVWYLDQPPANDARPRWPSPSYPGMVGNVLPEFLSISGAPFPPPATEYAPFPTLVETHEYLKKFASPFLKNSKIRLNHEVSKVDELSDGGWKVVLKNWNHTNPQEPQTLTETWDAVVVATAWYDTPAYPEVDGLEEAKQAGLLIHAKWYRGPQGYAGKRVLVVGNANSSNDMASQLVQVSETPVYRAIRRPPSIRWPALPDPLIVDVAPVARLVVVKNNLAPDIPPKLTVHLKDGTIISDVDTVFVGTGYINTPYYFNVLDPSVPTQSDGQRKLVPLASHETRPARVPSLHRQILYAHNPTLAWIGVVVSYTPFTLADVATTWLAILWSSPDKITIPSTAEEMLAYERHRLEEVQALRNAEGPNASSLVAYHVLAAAEKDYARDLRANVVAADGTYDSILPTWTDEDWVRRAAMYQVKYDWLQAARDSKAKSGILDVLEGAHL